MRGLRSHIDPVPTVYWVLRASGWLNLSRGGVVSFQEADRIAQANGFSSVGRFEERYGDQYVTVEDLHHLVVKSSRKRPRN